MKSQSLVPDWANKTQSMNFLTSLRGLAAFWVLLYHLKDQLLQFSILQEISLFLNKGYLAVDFFFILSGFIISYTYSDTFKDGVTKSELLTFVIKRFARIYPLHFFILILYLLFPIALFLTDRTINTTFYNPLSYLAKLFLVDLWLVNSELWNTWNVPSWTISGEWLAYILFPFLIFIIPKRPWFISSIAILLSCNLAFWYDNLSFDSIGEGIGQLGLLRCISSFMLGICVFYIYKTFESNVKSSFAVFNLFLSVITTSLIMLLIEKNHFFIPICFSWILFSFLISNTLLHSLLSKRCLVYFGDISYSLYLNHMFVITLYSTLFWSNELKASPLDLFLIITICIVFSHFTYQYIEKPCRRAIVNRFISSVE